MPSTADLLAFAVMSLLCMAISGASVHFTTSRALTFGRRPAVMIGLGVNLALTGRKD